MLFRNILLSAILVGIATGVLYGIFQQAQVSPIIYASEVYEVTEVVAEAHVHDAPSHSHAATAEPWGPNDGAERISYTIAADIAVAIAFALMMISLMALHNAKANKPQINALRGALWGGAAMLSFFVIPSLFGLHPEIPGTVAAELQDRQTWWIFCAGATVVGIAVLYYSPTKYKAAGILIALLPHIIGAPLPEVHGFANTEPAAVEALSLLSEQFFVTTTIGVGIFCIVLGSLSGFVVQRFIRIEA